MSVNVAWYLHEMRNLNLVHISLHLGLMRYVIIKGPLICLCNESIHDKVTTCYLPITTLPFLGSELVVNKIYHTNKDTYEVIDKDN